MIVLGVDPGSQRTGWGVVAKRGHELVLVDLGVIKAGTARTPLHHRLAYLQVELSAILKTHEPDLVGMETVFHGPNTRSLVTLGQARGALLASVGSTGLPLVELSPAEVKKALTGRGGATKEQVKHMVGVLLGPALAKQTGGKRMLDATDALAVGIAALHRQTNPALAVEGLPGSRSSERG
jgi:crossover junction endodeoxyribonuclease RuvC